MCWFVKRFRVSMIVGFCVVAALLSGCGGSEVAISEANDGSTVQLTAGQRLALTLASNATTGYQWEIVELDQSVLTSAGPAVYNGPAQQMPGAGGSQTFRFTAAKSGSTTLTLVYRRGTEQNATPPQRYSVRVVVQ